MNEASIEHTTNAPFTSVERRSSFYFNRMSFLTEVTPETPRDTSTALFMS